MNSQQCEQTLSNCFPLLHSFLPNFVANSRKYSFAILRNKMQFFPKTCPLSLLVLKRQLLILLIREIRSFPNAHYLSGFEPRHDAIGTTHILSGE